MFSVFLTMCVCLTAETSQARYSCQCQVDKSNMCHKNEPVSCAVDYCQQATACSNHTLSSCKLNSESNDADGYVCQCPSGHVLSSKSNCEGNAEVVKFCFFLIYEIFKFFFLLLWFHPVQSTKYSTA